MKVSRIMALSLLIPLCGTAILTVYLNAQERIVPKIGKAVIPKSDLDAEPDPNTIRKPVKRATPKSAFDAEPGPTLEVPIEIGSQQLPANRARYSRILRDPETLQLITEEQAADQEAKSLAVQYPQAGTEEKSAEVKKKLREKLVAIFAMQQKRRTAEIASIEERLARLKDVSKKRETNKDAIVDRRLEQLTGGVDELGWEESNQGATRFLLEAVEQPLYGVPVPKSNNFDEPPVTRPRASNLPATETDPASPVPVLPPSSK
jgi:hypothetical protein